jgi:hypothetical protein
MIKESNVGARILVRTIARYQLLSSALLRSIPVVSALFGDRAR